MNGQDTERRQASNELQLHMALEERRLSQIENDIQDLSTQLEAIKTSVADLVNAWRTANGVVSFVKWLASIATAIAALVIFVKTGLIK